MSAAGKVVSLPMRDGNLKEIDSADFRGIGC